MLIGSRLRKPNHNPMVKQTFHSRHHIRALNVIPKDTYFLGYIKASAWESRGFVITKRGCIILTHPHTLHIK